MNNTDKDKYELSESDKVKVVGMTVHMAISLVILTLTGLYYYFTEACQ